MQNSIEHIHLIGSASENFYGLGLKDTDGFETLYNSLKKLCMRTDILSRAVKIALDISSKMEIQKSDPNYELIEAYADGLKRPIQDVLFAFLLPEFIAAFNKWTPNLLGLIPGCSSLFTWDKENESLIHSRLLDYPLAGIFDQFERTVTYELKGRLKIFSLTTKGMPLPSLTSINEKGLTLALHYKHGNYFDMKGHSIFSTAFEILSYCTSIHDVKKYLKEYPSMSYWGLYLSDANGEVASFDICGKEIYQEKFDIKEHEYLYFNNRPILTENKNLELQPYGNKEQCQMRRSVFNEKWKKRKKLKNKTLESLRVLTTPLDQSKRSSKEWKLDTITPSTIQALSFNYKNDEIYINHGPAPKVYREDIIKYSKAFSVVQKSKVNTKESGTSLLWPGLREISLAQSAFDIGDIQKSFHHLQMGIEKFKGDPAETIFRFFFNVLEFMYEDNHKDLTYIYQEFRKLQNKLPPYLEDHLCLFIMRIEKILGIKDIDSHPKIRHPELKNIFEKEYKLKPVAIKLMRRLIYPRMEVLDIIYPL